MSREAEGLRNLVGDVGAWRPGMSEHELGVVAHAGLRAHRSFWPALQGAFRYRRLTMGELLDLIEWQWPAR